MAGMEMKGLIEAIGFSITVAKGLKSIDDKVKLNEAIYGIQESLLSAQQMALDNRQVMSELVEAKREIENEIATLREFETEKSRYQMHQTKAGGITYFVKEDAQNGEPPHHICANCYQQSKKSVLQIQGLGFVCINCGSTVNRTPRSVGFVAL